MRGSTAGAKTPAVGQYLAKHGHGAHGHTRTQWSRRQQVVRQQHRIGAGMGRDDRRATAQNRCVDLRFGC